MKTIKITAFLALYIGFIAATKANNLKIENISYEAGISKWSFDLSGRHSWIFSEHKSANPSIITHE